MCPRYRCAFGGKIILKSFLIIILLSIAFPFEFKITELKTGFTENQTVLTGNLLGNEVDDIAVINAGEHETPKLKIFSLINDEWKIKIDICLPEHFLFVDLVHFQGIEKLVLYNRGSLNIFDVDSQQVVPMKRLPFRFIPTCWNIPIVDISRDLNGDYLDDLIIPDFDGFWIFLQNEYGAFEKPFKIDAPEPHLDDTAFDDNRNYREVGFNKNTIPWYLSRVRSMDYNRDGLNDLVFWNKSQFDIYLQNETKGFESTPVQFKPYIPIDIDGMYSFIFSFSGENKWRLLFGLRSKSKKTILYELRDLNNDGIEDIITLSLEGKSLVNQKSTYSFYLGSENQNQIEFLEENSFKLILGGESGGLQIGGYSSLQLLDMDGDQKIDFFASEISMGFGSIFRAFVMNELFGYAEYYKMDYDDSDLIPNSKLIVQTDVHIFGEKEDSYFPFFHLGDLNGDSFSDILIGKRRGEISIYFGSDEENQFTEPPQIINVQIPNYELNSWMSDLDHDGKNEFMMKYPSDTSSYVIKILEID